MPPPNKKATLSGLRWLLLLLIPAAWALASALGWLRVPEDQALALRYRFRGEIAAPVKLIYVDVDTRAVQEMGERPWNRGDFATAAKALLEVGHAKGVGFDFVFSDFGASKMVSRDDLGKKNLELGRVTHAHPEVVLAAQYNAGQSYLQEGQRQFPLLRLGHADRAKNDLPELPQYPISGASVKKVGGTEVIKTWGTVGLIDIDYGYGGDEVPRWAPLFAETVNPTYYHMALKLAMLDLGLDDSAVRLSPDKLELARPDGSIAATIPLRERQLVEANWFSRWGNLQFNPHVSLADVLLYQHDLASDDDTAKKNAQHFFEQFHDAIILIGPVDALLQDLAPTPFDRNAVPKVGFHGNLLKTIRSGLYIHRLPEWMTSLLTVLLALGVALLAVGGGAKGIWYKLVGVVVLLGYVYAVLALFKTQHLVVPLVAPIGAAFTMSFAAVGWQLLAEEKQKGRIKSMFGTYVSPDLVNRMVESGETPQLGGHESEITAYFSDIQSFSSFSEKLASGPLVELMNEYLTACTDIVQQEGGTLDKYIGDAVVAMFGAPIALPDHALRACIATQRVQLKLGELRDKWRAEGGKWPEIVGRMQSRIGLNSGLATIGNMGSRTRFNYTMMGDNVNLAARMESGAKQYGVYTMVTEATKTACEQHGPGRLVFRYLDRIVVKGRTLPVPIYEVVGLSENVSAETRECLARFAAGIERYLAADWPGARRCFEESAVLEVHQPSRTPGVETNPSLTLLQRVDYMAAHPPGPDWNGVYVMKEK